MGGEQATLNPTKRSRHRRGRVHLSNEEYGSGDARRDSYLTKVKKSLRASQPDLGPNEITELAECLVDEEKMKVRWFSHLLRETEAAVEVLQEECRDFPEGYRNRAEQELGRERLTLINRVEKLEVKLLLYQLGDGGMLQSIATAFNRYLHNFRYGPHHAALLIGNILLDWNDSSLVIPTVTDNVDEDALILATNVHEENEREGAAVIVSQAPIQAGAECMGRVFEKQIQVVGEISREKQTLITELVRTAVAYNQKHEYGVLSNNCQHFVVDALEVLGITDPAEAFRGRLRQHAELLTQRGRDDRVAEFNTHQALDSHVEANIGTMSRDDLEFCYCHYLLFHAWNKQHPGKRRAWQCGANGTCQCENVAGRL